MCFWSKGQIYSDGRPLAGTLPGLPWLSEYLFVNSTFSSDHMTKVYLSFLSKFPLLIFIFHTTCKSILQLTPHLKTWHLKWSKLQNFSFIFNTSLQNYLGYMILITITMLFFLIPIDCIGYSTGMVCILSVYSKWWCFSWWPIQVWLRSSYRSQGKCYQRRFMVSNSLPR